MSQNPQPPIGHQLDRRDALLIVDVQNDFCPGGALPVADCRRVLEVLNAWIDAAQQGGSMIVASRDWHPPGHSSFRSRGGPWPEHCVQDTEGAQFREELRLPPRTIVISKGTAEDLEQYSPFDVSGLTDQLKQQGIRRLWIGGLAQDVCVRAAVLDALAAGFEVHVLVEGTAPVDEANGREALREMQSAGAILESDSR